jgi:hypothetical protein
MYPKKQFCNVNFILFHKSIRLSSVKILCEIKWKMKISSKQLVSYCIKKMLLHTFRLCTGVLKKQIGLMAKTSL